VVHNIWLQQLGKKSACLYNATFDDYVQTFKHSSLYWAYLNVGLSRKCQDRNGLHLCRTNVHLLNAFITKYAPSYSYASWMPHLKGEEVFKSHK
jgi:hypothetical protein